MTLPNSLNSGRTNAPASCTASLMALIPVFIGSEILLSDGQENQKMCSREKWHLNCFPGAGIRALGAARDDGRFLRRGSGLQGRRNASALWFEGTLRFHCRESSAGSVRLANDRSNQQPHEQRPRMKTNSPFRFERLGRTFAGMVLLTLLSASSPAATAAPVTSKQAAAVVIGWLSTDRRLWGRLWAGLSSAWTRSTTRLATPFTTWFIWHRRALSLWRRMIWWSRLWALPARASMTPRQPTPWAHW